MSMLVNQNLGNLYLNCESRKPWVKGLSTGEEGALVISAFTM